MPLAVTNMPQAQVCVRLQNVGPNPNPTATLVASSLNLKPQEVEPVAGVLGGESFPSSLVVSLYEWLVQFRLSPLKESLIPFRLYVRLEITCDCYPQFHLPLRRQLREMRIWASSELSKAVGLESKGAAADAKRRACQRRHRALRCETLELIS